VYYQFDTWQGPWRKATGAAPNFSATAPPPALGMHVLFAYATDGQFADSMQPGTGGNRQSSPIPGAIAAYVFVVVPPTTATSLALTNGTDPSVVGQTPTFTATVTSPSGTPTGSLVFYGFQGTQFITATVALTAGSAIWSPGLPMGVNTIYAIYSGDNNFGPSSSPPWAQYVMSNGTNLNTTTNLSITPEVFFRQSALFSVQVTTSAKPGGTITPAAGNVVLVGDGNRQFGPLLPLSENGTATTAAYSTPLRAGTYNIRAIYLGDSTHQGSNTSLQTVSASPRPKPR
jgi:hypothetical protein